MTEPDYHAQRGGNQTDPEPGADAIDWLVQTVFELGQNGCQTIRWRLYEDTSALVQGWDAIIKEDDMPPLGFRGDG